MGKTDQYIPGGGPVKNRGCTDILCCIFFILFTAFTIGIAGYAFVKGNPKVLAQGFDSDKMPCGVDERADYPLIYFLNPIDISRTACVKTCPTSGDDEKLDCFANSVTDCEASLDPTEFTTIYPSNAFGNKVCLPNQFADGEYMEQIEKKLHFDDFEEILSTLNKSYFIIIGAVIVTVILVWIFLMLLRWCAGVVIWLIILTVQFFLIVFSVLLYLNYHLMTHPETAAKYMNKEQLAYWKAKNKDRNPKLFLYTAIVCAVTTLVMAILICFFFKSLKVAIQIIKASSRFIQDNMTIVFVPVVWFMISLIYFLFWIIVATFLGSIGEQEKEYSAPFGQLDYTKTTKTLGGVHLFALFWNIQFFAACSTFIIISSVAIWYFNQLNEASPITTSWWRLFRYHLGTIAFGSLLVALVQMVRAILEYIDNQTKEVQNETIKYVLKCCKCCLWCFEQFIKFINKAAYVVTAVQGKSFIPAAIEAIKIILSNPVRVALVNMFSFIFEILGNLAISLTTAGLSYLACKYIPRYHDLESPMPTTVACFLISYIIASFFLDLYSISCNAMVLILCMDETDGKTTQHPAELDDFLEVSNEAEARQKQNEKK